MLDGLVEAGGRESREEAVGEGERESLGLIHGRQGGVSWSTPRCLVWGVDQVGDGAVESGSRWLGC